MATYKVIQDIEAEDKLIGPFGIRQFIYLIIVGVSLFIGFRLALVAWFLALPLLPHTLFFALLALPFGGDQPTETWLLAKIRFFLKPRRRIWDQSGAKELVTITAPKKVEQALTKNFSEGEVRSRLEALATTLDSRGWAIKNVSANMFQQPALAGASDTDRLVELDLNAAAPPAYDYTVADDILDEQNNPTAQNLDRMISTASKTRREQLIQNMKNPQAAQLPAPAPASTAATTGQPAVQPDYWFLNGSPGSSPGGAVITPDPAAARQQSQGLPLQPIGPTTGDLTEEELLDKIHAEKHKKPQGYGHTRVIKTLEEQQAEAQTAGKIQQPPVTPAPDPDILGLANNDDLNVATIARQANKKKAGDADGEVVINLH